MILTSWFIPGDNFTFLVSNFCWGWFRGNTKIEGGAGGSTNMTSFPRFLGWWGIRNFILFGKISSWSHEPNGGIMSWRLDRWRKQATRKSEGEDKSWKNYWRKPRRKYKQKRNSFIMSHQRWQLRGWQQFFSYCHLRMKWLNCRKISMLRERRQWTFASCLRRFSRSSLWNPWFCCYYFFHCRVFGPEQSVEANGQQLRPGSWK